MTPPAGSVTHQSHELQMGTNVLGPWLFTELLTPLLQKTASTSPPGSVRVTWAASLATMFSPKNGIAWSDATKTTPKLHGDRITDYAQSKASNVLLSREYAARHGKDSGIVSNSWNPGNLASELQRHSTAIEKFVVQFLVYKPIFGAYTELFAGWSEEAGKPENDGKYVVPWGRFGDLRADVKGSQDGVKLWEWCERESKPYM
jgi:retinol dehydrogenase-12